MAWLVQVSDFYRWALTSVWAALQLMDMLVEQTHDLKYEWRSNERPMRYTDTR